MIENFDVINPLAGKTSFSWFFEQAVYDIHGLSRAIKAGGGSGNIPKVIIWRNHDKILQCSNEGSL